MYRFLSSTNLISTIILGLFFLTPLTSNAQSVPIGEGSYSTTLPNGAVGPQTALGGDVSPKISNSFSKKIQTNDFWSSLIFPFQGSTHSNNIFAHPLNFKATAEGLQVGYTSTHSLVNNDYEYPFSHQITVGVNGLTASETLADDYGDWTVTALWENDSASMKATFGHGLPYAFFTVSGGNAIVTSAQTPTIWHNENEVLGITIDGNHYGIFAPSGASWSGTSTFESSLNGKDFFSIALLPDTNSETLELFRKHAYAFVTNSVIDWEYDESTSELTSTYTYETVLKDSNNSNINETLTALYRHQWLNTSDPLTTHTYNSPRGVMKLHEGSTFSTEMMFSGILPFMPDVGDYNRVQLLSYIQDVATENLDPDNTYNSGKAMGRFSQLVHVADQLGAIAERDYFLSEIKAQLENWFTVGGALEYSYNDTWDVLTGYPSAFGADREINDHHFHSSYAIGAATTIAQYDPEWASQEKWGAMVNLLIKDSNNWDRDDSQFPFLRNHDSYAGHSWASGHADFNSGNNQESSSESMNYSSAVFLWGQITDQPEIRDLGIFLNTTESVAIEQYWFDVDNEVFPQDYSKVALGIVWGNKGAHDTWFGNKPEFIHGINLLPINSGSVYLGRNPDYILDNYNAMVSVLGSQPTVWKDVFWEYLSMSDPDLALSYYNADPTYDPFDGESRAHTLHWLYNMKKMGHFNTEVFADISTYNVFVSPSDDTTYIAYNAGSAERLVTFSDGFSMNVPPNEMSVFNSSFVQGTLVPAPIPTDDPANVISIFSDTYASLPNTNFNPNWDQATVTTIENIDGNNTLKYAGLDFQGTEFGTPQNISSRSTLHIDYFTEDATELQLYLISAGPQETQYDFEVTSGSWQSVDIPLTVFSEVVDLVNVTQIKVVGNGTVYLDNIYFNGDTPVPDGPRVAAPTPIADANNVISIFSDAYTNVEGTNFNPDWDQTTLSTITTIQGNSTLKYENLNYQGTRIGSSQDVSGLDWFHLDYWTDNATDLKVFLISPGPQETPVTLEVVNNEWQSIDIPLSSFSDVVDLSDVFQIKIEGNGTIFFDNLFFWKDSEISSAPAPIHDPQKVVSLFSNTYENVTVDTWSAGWDQADLEDVLIDDEDGVKFYSNLTFAGIEFTSVTIDATNLTHFRFDLWTANPTSPPAQFRVKLVDFGANGVWSGGDDVEHELIFDADSNPALVSNNWVSFDIPLTDFTNMVTKEHLAQLLFINSSGLDEVYIDNIYFYGDQVISSVEDDEVPAIFNLSQNYPNPFNPSTNIQFSIPNASQASLIVFNSLGQRVATLVDSRLSSGSHTVTWDASAAPSGIYFYRLKAGDTEQTKRMVLIK